MAGAEGNSSHLDFFTLGPVVDYRAADKQIPALFHPNEYIHYPQYAILAVLLALCIDPHRISVPWMRILFWTSLLGFFDEMNQYFYLCKSYGDYLDFNDALMNLLGAQAGCCCSMASAYCHHQSHLFVLFLQWQNLLLKAVKVKPF